MKIDLLKTSLLLPVPHRGSLDTFEANASVTAHRCEITMIEHGNIAIKFPGQTGVFLVPPSSVKYCKFTPGAAK